MTPPSPAKQLARYEDLFVRLADGSWVRHSVHSADDVARIGPFAAIELELSWLWGREPPAPEPPESD